MKVFVIGGSGSGKSEWAELKALELLGEGKRAVYLATMRKDGEESEKRIKKHRESRQGRNFVTVEAETDLTVVEEYCQISDTVLIEDLSNLLSNLRYSKQLSFAEAEKTITDQIRKLGLLFKNLIIVSNDVFSDGIQYHPETKRYMKSLALLNAGLAESSDIFAEIVVGIPIIKNMTGKL